MNRKQSIIKAILPSILLLLLIFLQGMFVGSIGFILFSLLYIIICIAMLSYPIYFPIVVIFIYGVLIDSINSIALGTSSFIFLLNYLLIVLEQKYMKNKDLLVASLFFAINTIVISLVIIILNVFIDIKYMNILTFLLTTVSLFPFIFIIIHMCVNFMNKDIYEN